jgi:single-stranded DNA-specific DHH superfamily exonuclease
MEMSVGAEGGGGHAAAGGITVHENNLNAWCQWMNARLCEIKIIDDVVDIDVTIKVESHMNLVNDIAGFGPFGFGRNGVHSAVWCCFSCLFSCKKYLIY